MKSLRKFSSFNLDNINYLAVSRYKKLIIYSSDDLNLIQVRIICVNNDN